MSTANITVTANEPVITVSNDLANVSVTTAISNVVVGEAVFAGNADVRAALSGGTGVVYNSTTGVIAIGQAVAASDTVDFSGLQVKDLNDAGEIQIGSTVGGTSNQGQLRLTANSLYQTQITGYGNLTLDTVNPTGVGVKPSIYVWSELEAYANISTTANVSGAYILGDGSQLTNVSTLTNAQAKAYIETNGLAMTSAITSNSDITTTANISALDITATDITATGNVDVTGNISADTFKGTNIESQGALDIKINADGTYDTDVFSVSNSGGVLTNTFQVNSGGPKFFRVGSDSTGDGQTQTGTLKIYGDTVGGIESVVVDEGNIEVANGFILANVIGNAGKINLQNTVVGSGGPGVNDPFFALQSWADPGSNPNITLALNDYITVAESGNIDFYVNPAGPDGFQGIGSGLPGGFKVRDLANVELFGVISDHELSGVRIPGYVRSNSTFIANGNLEANSNIIVRDAMRFEGSGAIEGNATVNGELNVTGNLEVTGNINYREVTDLLVQDQTITLNYGNASAQDAQIIVDRQGSGLANVDLKWNETTDKWQFSNDGTTYNNMLTDADAQAYIETNGLDLTANLNTTASINTNIINANPLSGNIVIGGVGSSAAEKIDIHMQGDFAITQNRSGSIEKVLTAESASGNTILSVNGPGASPAYSEFKMLGRTGGSSGMFTVDTDGNTRASGNIQSYEYFIGNGSLLTGMLNNAQVQAYIETNGLAMTSAITSDSDITTTADLKQTSTNGYMQAAGNVHFLNSSTENPPTGANLTTGVNIFKNAGDNFGNINIGSGLRFNQDGFPVAGMKNRLKETQFQGNIELSSGNIRLTDGTNEFGNITNQGVITTAANVTASYFIGDGSALTNLPTQIPDLDTGNVYVGNANVTVQVTPSTNFVTQVTTSGSTTFAIESITPFQNGSVNVDAVTFVGGQIYSDGLQVVISGVTASGATALNGLTFYLKWTNGDGGVYELYDNVGLTTASQRATGSYINPTNGIITYSGGTIITPTFALADTVTVANVQLTNELQSSAGANLNINSNTKNVVFKKDYQSITDQSQLEINPEGWAVDQVNSTPTYSGTAERVAYVIEGSATSGSNVITVTAAETFVAAYGTGWNGTAPSTAGRTDMFTGSNPIAVNYVSQTKGSETNSQSPFAPGTIIQSIDTVANTITMSTPALVNYTFAWNGGGQNQETYLLCSGAYNEDVGASFIMLSNFDSQNLSPAPPDSSKVTIYAQFNISQDRYGFGPTGPETIDLSYSIGTSADYTKPSYSTRGKVSLNGDRSFVTTNYGIGIGKNVAVTNRITNDRFASFGYAQLWDGTESYASEFGVASAIPQIAMKQYTQGTAQASQPHLGPRQMFLSAYGNINEPTNTWYPRQGQEIGRIGFWGSHGNLENPSSTAVPAYLSVQAADDWTTGSNAGMYMVGTSDYDNQYRMPFMSFEKGQLILASGIKNGAQESVEFAPGVGVTNNPANAYDFSAGPSGTTGWASINYENVGGQTGAELSVNNGGSLGVGNVGDMAIGLHRKDNSYTASVSSTARQGLIYNGPGSGASGDIFDFQNNPPLIGLPDATPVVASGFSGYFAPINGQTLYTLKVFGGQFIVLYEDVGLTIPVQYIPSGVNYAQDFGSLTYSTSAASGVTDKEWTLSLAEQSEDLVLKGNTTTQVTFTDSRTDLNSSLKLKSYTTTEVNALPSPQAGDTVFCTDASGGATIVFHNGTSWQKVSHANL